ncbi:hypothetical protein QNI19_08305 [Cytophagaceae bacterium DM2B3-1]|uniref:Uncharacterized protein n=1 Tax=Xanthocytophaga flava TaxID=3048013 RepID=A0ABT7CGR3_9BACT|nr:hypothetical protein [Xanthocytophaga flavus]MDJ1492930.1 hypothetical protein [Xanthocytophaga flavus]
MRNRPFGLGRLKLVGVTGCYLVIAILLISTKSVNEDENISRYYKDIRDYGLQDFINMDLGLLSYFPKKEHWKAISANSRLVPIDSLRYIDSLDVRTLKDTLYVSIYSQNYAYQSKNVYKIAKNTNKLSDTLMIFTIGVNLKLKEEVADVETFRTQDFSVHYKTRQPVSNRFQRIVFSKSYR